jgi:putative transcriptional regulator
MTMLSPLDRLLMDYAAGRLSAPESLVVAAHLTINTEARRKVSQYEAFGGRLMCETEPAPVRAECLSNVLTRIGTAPPAVREVSAPPACGLAPDVPVPPAIRTLIAGVCRRLETDGWTRVTPGFSKMELRLASEPRPAQRLRLMRLDPGQGAPRHAHRGTEITLVLQGSFSDETGRYGPGDILIIADPRLVHQPVAAAEGCVCLTLTEAPLRFEEPMRRIMNAFWRV